MKTPNVRRLAILAGLGILVGCQNTDVAAPSQAAPAGYAASQGGFKLPKGMAFGGNANANFHASSCSNHVTASYSGVFGPAGGTLQFGGSQLIIPGGALRDTVTITATVLDSTTGRVEFQPTGLQFNQPVGLLLNTDGCTISPDGAPSVVYLSEDGQVLEYIPAVWDPRWKTFAASIWHFSGYAIGF